MCGPDSGPSDQFVHGMNVLVARNYILNLREETRKGMLEKARSGIYPSFAPVDTGTRTVPMVKRDRYVTLNAAPVITELFVRFSAGRIR